MSADPNIYYCSNCGFEFKDYHHRNGSFYFYCMRCKKDTLFSNALREVVMNEKKNEEQKLLID